MGVAQLGAAAAATGKPVAAVAVAGAFTAAIVVSAAPDSETPVQAPQQQAPVVGAQFPPGDGSAQPIVAPPGAPREPAAPRVRPVAAVSGMPAQAYYAYLRAAADVARKLPDCHLPASLLAAIGKVESDHANGGLLDAAGTAANRILGPVLDGRSGTAAIADTDRGRLDGSNSWDRAVGPMQFLPGTWRRWAVDANGDRHADPNNLFDAATAAGHYLCAGGRDLATEEGLRAGILSYNRSTSYLRVVLDWMDVYARGVVLSPQQPHRDAIGPQPGSRSTPAEGPRSRPGSPSTTSEPPPSTEPSTEPPPSPQPEEPGRQEPPHGLVIDLDCVLDQITEGLMGPLDVPEVLGRDHPCVQLPE